MFNTLGCTKYSSKIHEIFAKIFDGYNRHIRPVRNLSTTTVVYMDNGLRSIINTDEVHQVLVLKEWLRMFWRDEFLTWNPAEYDNITEIKVPRSLIWLPDVIRIDVLDQSQLMEDDRSFVLLDHTGFIRHSVDHVLRVFCDYKITMFPFDHQNCTIHYEPWHSTQKEVFIEVHPEADINNYRPSNEWDLISYTARTGLGSYPPILSQSTARAYYDIVIKRR
ncbi:Neurotransmitter-gated ion-channel ligand binding domain protein [Ancylostoma caninum]|uniref:Neurotransmitter-gated ion-channel ligand binding domain protein n=2 Tax=Ancylostoma TaxID=29169 RepID=A0A368FCX8_ANCCA|nr:Neurotransmitter-gated ion-channel ligand binding domain protein [Ancylostoma caninum]